MKNENSRNSHGVGVAIMEFLRSPKAGIILPVLFIFGPLPFAVFRTAILILMPEGTQLNGYYIGVLERGFYISIAALWLFSILILLFRRRLKRGILRVFAMPLILFIAVIMGVFCGFFPSAISGWPIDAVYSESDQKYYILVYQPVFMDTCYCVFSTKRTLLNPIWGVEFGSMTLEYSEDGSLTKDPHLILSEDEKLLVIGRGGHLTDAILVESKQPLTTNVIWSANDREKQWGHRTNNIKSLLEKHSVKKNQPEDR